MESLTTRRRHRAKTDFTNSQATAAKTLADTGLPPARRQHNDPKDAWQELQVLGAYGESLVLQRVRHLTLYLVTRALGPKGPGLIDLAVSLRLALKAFARSFAGLMPAAETNSWKTPTTWPKRERAIPRPAVGEARRMIVCRARRLLCTETTCG